jgi:hypothetical protein
MSGEIRNKHGELLGRVGTRADGKQELRNKHGQLLGVYDPDRDQTRDRYGTLVAEGNALSSFLQD